MLKQFNLICYCISSEDKTRQESLAGLIELNYLG